VFFFVYREFGVGRKQRRASEQVGQRLRCRRSPTAADAAREEAGAEAFVSAELQTPAETSSGGPCSSRQAASTADVLLDGVVCLE